MEWISNLSLWQTTLLVFLVRIIDVSIGTLRTLSVVQGRIALSVVLGFFEVLVWIVALSQVLTGVTQNPVLMVAYAGGFAAGNAVGICVERKLAMGAVVVRMISAQFGSEIAVALRTAGHRATTFLGEGRDGPVTLIYASCNRRNVAKVVRIAKDFEPQVFYTVEPVQHVSSPQILPHATGWRSILKKK
ncbi:MAG: DUF2179 domain-containing protein [Planctomycetales bacterium]|nr:DUF2179 domain-containing protein [Planctomycetales bacterium]